MAVETPGRQGTEGRLAGPIRRAPGSKPVRTTLLSTIVSRARTARCRTAGPRPWGSSRPRSLSLRHDRSTNPTGRSH